MEKQLNKLGIKTVRDLLLYYPFRYEDYSKVEKIANLEDGKQVTIKAEITKLSSRYNPRTRMVIVEAEVADDSGVCNLIWFGQRFIIKVLKTGDWVNFSGKVSVNKKGISLASPSYEKIRAGFSTAHTARIVPIYPLTYGISQKQLRFLVSQVVGESTNIADWLPDDILEKTGLMQLNEAISKIHFPVSENDIETAKKRLKFDELFILQLRAEMIRQSLKRQKASRIEFDKDVVKKFLEKLSFTLTDAQKIATWEIFQDMNKAEPMNRLLQGDVGAGKTVVAAICANSALEKGFQVIVMAPTEVLASQHYESFVSLFKDGKNNVCLYTRSKAEIHNDNNIGHLSTLVKKKNYIGEKIRKGELKIAIGTHALLSENLVFKNLGLVVVDEQQRFGVEQRRLIRQKNIYGLPDASVGMLDFQTKPAASRKSAHFLSMTATPIPRSLALTLYGDLDVSIIRGLPPGRKKIITRLVAKNDRTKAYDFIRGQVKQGRQIFVICPLVEITEDNILKFDQLDKKNVLDEYKKLSEKIFPDLKVAYMYGKMKPVEKSAIMEKMNKGEIDILVSTSVVEVGVDIPNASVMVIEDAERFGLAQLHQFRGRVGRSVYQSYCFLFTQHHFCVKNGAGFTENFSQKSQDRLKFFEKNNDGFKLAEFDLAQRGPGEVYGTAQSGIMNLKFASTRDIDLIKTARQLASGIDFSKYPSLKERVKEWESGMHLE